MSDHTVLLLELLIGLALAFLIAPGPPPPRGL